MVSIFGGTPQPVSEPKPTPPPPSQAQAAPMPSIGDVIAADTQAYNNAGPRSVDEAQPEVSPSMNVDKRTGEVLDPVPPVGVATGMKKKSERASVDEAPVDEAPEAAPVDDSTADPDAVVAEASASSGDESTDAPVSLPGQVDFEAAKEAARLEEKAKNDEFDALPPGERFVEVAKERCETLGFPLPDEVLTDLHDRYGVLERKDREAARKAAQEAVTGYIHADKFVETKAMQSVVDLFGKRVPRARPKPMNRMRAKQVNARISLEVLAALVEASRPDDMDVAAEVEAKLDGAWADTGTYVQWIEMGRDKETEPQVSQPVRKAFLALRHIFPSEGPRSLKKSSRRSTAVPSEDGDRPSVADHIRALFDGLNQNDFLSVDQMCGALTAEYPEAEHRPTAQQVRNTLAPSDGIPRVAGIVPYSLPDGTHGAYKA